MRTVLPLSSFPIADTTDVDNAQRLLSQQLHLVDTRVQQVVEPARFRLTMNGVDLEKTMVSFNRFGTDTVMDAGWVDDTVIVVVGDNLPSAIHLDGKSVVVTPEQAAILSPGRRVVNERPAHAGACGIVAPVSAITQRLYELTDWHVNQPIEFDHRADLTSGPGAQVARMLRFVLAELQQVEPSLANQTLYAAFDDMLLSALLLLPHNYRKALEQTRPQTVTPPLVRRAEAYLEAHASEPVSMADLVAVCGCSRAALFKSFQRFRGYTPMQFLTERRLQKAREHLLEAQSDVTITAIAYGCGFAHLGRFAKAYRQRFGEKPSDTRCRAT